MRSKQPRIIAYYRVSTVRQGASGLGLEAQQEAVRAYARENRVKVLTAYTEVESGKNGDRPELKRAIGHARRSKATLVVAKLDRLARNVAFLSGLMENGFDFVACDFPNVNRLTVHVISAFAEDEARRISQRTREALAAAKRRGVLLGSARPGHWDDPARRQARIDGLAKGRKRSAEVRRQRAHERVADLVAPIAKWRDAGLSYAKIATRLTEAGHTTARGKQWTPNAVRRVSLLS